MLSQVRRVIQRPVGVNTRVIPVSSAVEAVFGVIFMEAMHPLISPRRFPGGKRQVADEGYVGNFLWKLDCFRVRYVAIHFRYHIHQSWSGLYHTYAVRLDKVSDVRLHRLLIRILDMYKKTGVHDRLVVLSSFEQLLTQGLLPLPLHAVLFLFAQHCFSFFCGSRRNQASRSLHFHSQNFLFLQMNPHRARLQ